MAVDQNRPHLRLVDGGGEKLSKWLSPPSTVVGRAPFDKTAIMAYRVAPGDLRQHVKSGRRQPILDLWWHVYGELPPLMGAGRHSSILNAADTGLHTAKACFRGLMRPIAEDDRGFDHIAFITKPKFGFRYQPSMNCLIEPYAIPDDLVFAIYAHLDFPEGRAYRNKRDRPPITNGVVTHWHLVECDPENPLLPIDHRERFTRKLW